VTTDQFRPAIHRYGTARGYSLSAAMIFHSPDRKPSNEIATILPVLSLVGFSIELYLKAILLEDGMTDKELGRPPFGHNLHQLWSETQQRGFPDVDDMGLLLHYVGKDHRELAYRYSDSTRNYHVPNFNAVFVTLNNLDDAIDEKLGASAGRGLSVGRQETPSHRGRQYFDRD